MTRGKIGIDLGTTFSCCGVFKSCRVELIPYKTGMKTIPSHVYYSPETTEIVVGSAAKYNIKTIGHDVFDSKRFIGRKFKDPLIQKDMNHWPFKVVQGRDGEPLVELQHNNRVIQVTANNISTEILKSIKQTADEFMGQDSSLPTEAVVTVPAYFDNQQRQNTIEAARNANLKIIKIINEPTAAAIAYAYQRIQQGSSKDVERLLIYDFGGGTFDVSIIKIDYRKQNISVLATEGDSHLGGEDIDQRLVEYYSSLYSSKTQKRISEKQRFQLRKACEAAKCLVSINDEVLVDWNPLEDEGIDNTLRISKFDEMNKDLFNKTMNKVDSALTGADLNVNDIDYIVLVGGSSRIKKVQDLLKEKFPERTVICKDINPDEVVAYGACLYANMENMHFKIEDIITHTLSTDVEKDGKTILYPLIKKNTPIPYRSEKPESFANFAAGDDRINITVYEGEGTSPDDEGIRQLDSKPFMIPVSNVKAGSYVIDILYNVDENGILTIEVKDRQNGKKDVLEIRLK